VCPSVGPWLQSVKSWVGVLVENGFPVDGCVRIQCSFGSRIILKMVFLAVDQGSPRGCTMEPDANAVRFKILDGLPGGRRADQKRLPCRKRPGTRLMLGAVRLVSPDFASSRETRQGVAAAGQHDRPLNTNLWVCKHDAKDEVPGGLSATLPQSGRIRVRRDGRGTEIALSPKLCAIGVTGVAFFRCLKRRA